MSHSISFFNRMHEVIYPPKLPNSDTSSVLSALARQRIARIVRAAAYVFATLFTIATIVLTEGRLITWPIAVPVITIAVISWTVFWWMNRLDERYLEGIDDTKRTEIAKTELEKLLFTQHLSSFPDAKSISIAFENINKIIGAEVATTAFVEILVAIKNRSPATKTFIESAEEQGISLALSCKKDLVEKGWFGRKTITKKLDFEWSGKREDPIKITLKT